MNNMKKIEYINLSLSKHSKQNLGVLGSMNCSYSYYNSFCDFSKSLLIILYLTLKTLYIPAFRFISNKSSMYMPKWVFMLQILHKNRHKANL